MSVASPPPIPAYQEGTFAHFTMQHRLPRILGGVRAELGGAAAKDPRWSELESAIVAGAAIDLGAIVADTPFWERTLARLANARWSDLPFFDLEFLFYRAINSIVDDLRPGFDVFASVRQGALADALPRVARTLEATDGVDLEALLLLATLGNEADLSQIASGRRAAIDASALLVDERPRIAGLLAGGGTVQILADNAGSELCVDLIVADALLGASASSVEIQLKPRPMFVSDALIGDAEEAIARFAAQGDGTRIARTGARLQRALGDGRLTLSAPLDWAEPRHMNALEPDLGAALRSATVVLAKGDLHYRRFFEDRMWPADTPVARASIATGMRAFALRVLKSDSIVGLDPAEVARRFAADPAWRSSSRHALVQRVDDLTR